MIPAGAITQLQTYLRHSAEHEYQAVPFPPFTIYLQPGGEHSDDDHAVPDEPLEDEPHEPVSRLRKAFGEIARRTRIRFLREFAPLLAPAVRAEGLEEERSVELLAGTPGSLILPPEVRGLSTVTLDANSALADMRKGLDTNERGFNPQAEPVSDSQAQAFREGLVDSRAFIALMNGRPVGAGMFNPPYEGVTELVGITTVEAYRRHGVAACLTAHAARTAFDRGVDLVFLSTDNAVARRVYERLGFVPCATLLTYADPPLQR